MAEFVAIFWPYKSGQSCCRCCCCCCCCFCRCYSTLNCCCCSCCHSAGWLNLAPSDTEATPTPQPKPAPAIVASLLAWGCAVDTHTHACTHTHNKYPHLYVKQENGQSRWSHRNLLPWKAAKSQSGDGLAPTAIHTHIRTHTTIALKSAAKHTHTIV